MLLLGVRQTFKNKRKTRIFKFIFERGLRMSSLQCGSEQEKRNLTLGEAQVHKMNKENGGKQHKLSCSYF